MRIIGEILFDLLLFYLIFGHALIRKFYPRPRKLKALLRDYHKHYSHLLRRDRDILPTAQCEQLQATLAALTHARIQFVPEQAEEILDRFQDPANLGIAKKKLAWVKEYLEIFVVALALAFGVRGLFLQPFKIPTGSMQPTLYGIHFEELDAAPGLNPIKRFVGYLHHSRRYVDRTVKRAGYLESIQVAKPPIPFFPTSVVQIAGVSYRLPGAPENVVRYCSKLKEYRYSLGAALSQGIFFNEGDVLARGYLELGDHLFVDRTHFYFDEPSRGDITVFLTDGIRDAGGGSLGGRYYIKRLVGLPGDTIKINKRKLYVKTTDDDDFRLADNSVNPAFERIYSFRGNYRGYCHLPGSEYLRTGDETFTVPQDCYFMLGDNSENSKDSRFWGIVPRENLVGRASFVWWPFSRRWGVSDKIEPLQFPSLPTVPEPSR